MMNSGSYLLSDYVLLGLTVGTLGVGLMTNRETTLSLHVNNLLDIQYSEPGYLGVDIPGMPRSGFAKLTQES